MNENQLFQTAKRIKPNPATWPLILVDRAREDMAVRHPRPAQKEQHMIPMAIAAGLLVSFSALLALQVRSTPARNAVVAATSSAASATQEENATRTDSVRMDPLVAWAINDLDPDSMFISGVTE